MGFLTATPCSRDNRLTNVVRPACLVILFCCLISRCVSGAAVSEGVVEGAVTYLLSKQHQDGNWSDEGQKVIDTVEVIKALRPFSYREDVQAAVDKGLLYVEGLAGTSTDVEARKLWALAGAGADTTLLKGSLLCLQNSDGGWGLGAKKQSDALDTVLVLGALLQAPDVNDSDALRAGRDFLVSSQDPKVGCWRLGDEQSPSDIARTAMALSVLKNLEKAGLGISSAAEAALQARDFLESEASPNDVSIPCADIALVYRALLRVREPCDVDGYLVRLLAERASNGSWSDDVFTTAMVLEALNTVQPPAPPEMADLAVYSNSIRFDPAWPAVGQAVEIKAMVENEGQLPAGPFYVEFYNGDPQAGGQLIGEAFWIGGIAPGSAGDANVVYSETSGLYDEQLIIVAVDPNDEVNEIDYSNNFAWKVLTFGASSPDLQIEAEDGITIYDIYGNVLTGNPSGWQPIGIVAEITNAGAKTEADFDVKLEDLNDANIHGTIVFEGLAHDQLGRATFVCALPEGGHTIKVTADANGIVDESDENNNEATKVVEVGAYSGPSGQFPELEIEAGDIGISETDAAVGEKIEITATVHNLDTADSDGFYVMVTDGSPYAEGILVSSVYVPGLAGLSDYQVGPISYEVVYRECGNEIFVLADCNGDIYEYNKANNLASKRLDVPAAPDLTTSPEFIRFSHTNLVSSRSVHVFSSVRNIGEGAAEDVSVKFTTEVGGT